MGRDAQRKKRRREERRLLELYPDRRCGFLNSNKRVLKGAPPRCGLAGRWEVEIAEGQNTYDMLTREDRTSAGTVYACNFHAAMFRVNGNKMKRIG